ncbi:MAG: hypothetical protein WAM14_26080 [Candidatus Nitrosopolaris sp.]
MGHKMTSGLSAIGWLDSSFIFHFPAIGAIATIPSVHANGSPIHDDTQYHFCMEAISGNLRE